ncbi:MAG: SDR family NAD(P)-dependent oxidoreductase, partial [Pseudomonadales bacterium]|nr:SDR family NAD(P)-dependent oxidoreductase [Pseudomonadales bacterium]
MGDKLAGRVAAITGGTAGIGLAIAEAYLAEGAAVALMARNPDKGAAAVIALNARDRAVFIAGDAMVQSDIEGFI